MLTITKHTLSLLSVILMLSACSGTRALSPKLEPIAIPTQAVAEQNNFHRDKTGGIEEDALRVLLNAPVFLEEDTRIGIVPVTVAYEFNRDLPLTMVPEMLGDALEGTGFFEVASEMSTDWPTDISIAGLRELAARYRTRYILLYRHRFEAETFTNAWGWAYLTVVATPFVTSHTLETAGVLEATLFDAQSGTLLFTVYERVQATADVNLWHNERKLRALQSKLLVEASEALSSTVVDKVHRLVAARPAKKEAVEVATHVPSAVTPSTVGQLAPAP